MDPEEERVLYLTRVGREKIFKYGTYTVTQQKPITQDHPFYAPRDDMDESAAEAPAPQAFGGDMGAVEAQNAPAAPVQQEEADPEALAGQIISSNFKVGLSQEEVDALLNGI